MLEIWLGEERLEFATGPVVIGRAENNDVSIDDPRISRRHVELRVERGRWVAADLQSANGTFVAGRKVAQFDLVRPTEVFLADPTTGIHLRLVPDPGAATITVTPTSGSARATRIGRARDNDLVLDDARVSRYHAELTSQPGEDAQLRDCGSANGIRANGARIEHATIRAGDVIEIGDTTLRAVTVGAYLELEVVAEGSTLRPVSDDTGVTPAPVGEPAQQPAVTNRERDLLALLAGGATDRQIADALYISIATVRSHLDRIHEKTGRRRRADLTRLALELGITPTKPPARA